MAIEQGFEPYRERIFPLRDRAHHIRLAIRERVSFPKTSDSLVKEAKKDLRFIVDSAAPKNLGEGGEDVQLIEEALEEKDIEPEKAQEAIEAVDRLEQKAVSQGQEELGISTED